MNEVPIRHALRLPLLFAALGSAGAIAQSEGPSQPALEEIVVTARYRAETLQDSPMAITAYNESTLEDLVALDLRAVAPATPNVRIQSVNQFANSAAISVRGMSSVDIESTSEMRVGVSVNGVFLSRPVASLIDLFDVERVEVLRGPQGTTFGKNSLAGGININTIRPDGTFDAKAEVTTGNYGRADFRGAIQAPIVQDKLSGRLAVLMQNYDGHNRNRFDGKRLDGQDTDTVRGTLVWTPTETVANTLIGHWLEARNDAPGGVGHSDPNQLLSAVFGFTEPDDGTHRVGRDTPAFHDTDQWGVTNILEWDLGDWIATSVTGYQATDDWIASDFDNTELTIFSTFRDQVHDQFSQELRLQSNFSRFDDWRGNLDLVLGLYYFEQEHELVQSYVIAPAPGFSLPGSADYTTQDNTSQAIFGQAIYALTDDLNVTFGVRHTREKKDFERNPSFLVPGLDIQRPDETVPSIGEASRLPRTLVGDLDSDNTSFKFGIDYHFTPNLMGFATYSQGFKAGEFGPRSASPFAMGPTEDEEADSYEIGIKSEWFDGRLRVNATAFYTNYDNLQFSVFVPSDAHESGQESIADNIGEITSKGFELELVAVPIEGLTLQASLGLLDAEYDEFCASLLGPVPATNPVSDCGTVTQLPNGLWLIETDNTHYEVTRAPDTQAFLGASYELFTPIGSVLLRASAEYESEFFVGSANNHPAAETGDYWLIDAGIGWRSLDESWRVQAWCKNCSDKDYVNGFVPTAQFFNQMFFGAPRTYGLTLGYQF